MLTSLTRSVLFGPKYIGSLSTRSFGLSVFNLLETPENTQESLDEAIELGDIYRSLTILHQMREAGRIPSLPSYLLLYRISTQYHTNLYTQTFPWFIEDHLYEMKGGMVDLSRVLSNLSPLDGFEQTKLLPRFKTILQQYQMSSDPSTQQDQRDKRDQRDQREDSEGEGAPEQQQQTTTLSDSGWLLKEDLIENLVTIAASYAIDQLQDHLSTQWSEMDDGVVDPITKVISVLNMSEELYAHPRRKQMVD